MKENLGKVAVHLGFYQPHYSSSIFEYNGDRFECRWMDIGFFAISLRKYNSYKILKYTDFNNDILLIIKEILKFYDL